MERTLPLEKGEILLSGTKIIIKDNAKRDKWLRISASVMWILFGVFYILRYQKTEEEFLLWSGTLVGLGHLVVLVLSFFRTAKSEVDLQEIVKAVFKKRNGNEFLDLKLINGKKRRISKVAPASEALKAFLLENNIVVN